MYSKNQAYRIFIIVGQELKEFEQSLSRFLEDADSMPLNLKRSRIRKLKNQLEKINLKNLDYFLDHIKGTSYYDEFKEEADEMISKADEMEEKLYAAGQDEPVEEEPSKDNSNLEDIRNRYNFIKREYGSSDIDTMIAELKKLDREIGRLDFEYLEEGDYDEMLQIRNDVSSLKKILEGVKKSEKYGPYLKEPLKELVEKYSNILNKDRIAARVATIIDFIEDPEIIEIYEPSIKRIISKKMTAKEFRAFEDSVLTARKNYQKFESLKDYNNWRNAIS
ncbi:MAG TPA: hypothetical protein PK122_00135 [Candidatus Paceibacterota bacterium]|nr:hypothetical protein [Candidatus Paceibacterota bacterium]